MSTLCRYEVLPKNILLLATLISWTLGSTINNNNHRNWGNHLFDETIIQTRNQILEDTDLEGISINRDTIRITQSARTPGIIFLTFVLVGTKGQDQWSIKCMIRSTNNKNSIPLIISELQQSVNLLTLKAILQKHSCEVVEIGLLFNTAAGNSLVFGVYKPPVVTLSGTLRRPEPINLSNMLEVVRIFGSYGSFVPEYHNRQTIQDKLEQIGLSLAKEID